MKIKRLTIRRYKGVTNTVTVSPGALAVLIGKNDCGKSTIVDAMQILLQPQAVTSRSQDAAADLAMELIFDEHDIVACGGTGTTATVTVTLQQGRWQYAASNRSLATTKLPPYLASQFIRISHDEPLPTNQVMEVWRDLMATHHGSRLFRILGDVFPQVNIPEELTQKNYLQTVLVNDQGEQVFFERFGTGFKHFFVQALYLLSPRFRLVVFDEPEIHFHPILVKRLLQLLQEEMAFNQIICTTHSPLLIEPDMLPYLLRVERQGSKTTVWQGDRQRIDRARLVQELNADNKEMFFADKVLLVEGVSDRILMRALIDRYYGKKQEIKVVYGAGKENLDIYVDLLESFGIPVVVMLDRDALRDRTIGVIERYWGKGMPRGAAAQINFLKTKNVFVLPNGALENHYPRRYQSRDLSKPMMALHAAQRLTGDEYASNYMQPIREIVESL